jgi:phosphoribosylpyrophosphate synthetase
MDGKACTPIKLFELNSTKAYAESVAAELGISLTPHEEKEFEDGECYVKPVDGPEGNVRGHNVFVIQSLYRSSEPKAPTVKLLGRKVTERSERDCDQAL